MVTELNSIDSTAQHGGARFLESRLTLSIPVGQSGRGKLVSKETGYGKRQGGSAIRISPAVDPPAPFETHPLPTDSSDEAKNWIMKPRATSTTPPGERDVNALLTDQDLTRIRDHLSMDDSHVVSEGVTRRRR